ncbi:unnamed protein product [Notodromas monacha]|uniref:CHK kinase-like domain-containing protein n=1 Tax=Notodromas monacha TaxID=399045 RepID=A0A7R9BHB7_9CRUS|nr:unnamed protein product [Notodromas monacha]CAG0913915.1 unnamed protein product [Notodromas monacha]
MAIIDKLWLKKVINHSKLHEGEVNVCHYVVSKGLSKGENYASLTYRCAVVYQVQNEGQEERRLDLFIKTLPFGEQHKAAMEEFGAFVREAAFYQELLPDMRKNVDDVGAPKWCYPDAPICVFSQKDGPDATIVMLDLSLLGYRVGDRQNGVTEDEARIALRSLAKFHANGIEIARKLGSDYNSSAKYPDILKPPFDSNVMRDFMKGNLVFRHMENSLRKIPGHEAKADRLKKYLDNTCVDGAERLLLMRQFKGNPALNTYQLGDCWVNNMMFRDGDDEKGNKRVRGIRQLDFQLVQAGSLFPDLHYFFGSSTNIELRRKTKTLLKEEYYPVLFQVLSELKAPLKPTDYTFDDFWKEFQAGKEFTLLTGMFVLPIIMARKDDIPDYQENDLAIEDFQSMTEGVMAGESSHKILERFADIVQEMIDDGVI